MRVDHVSYAAEPGGLRDAAFELAEMLGVTAVDGGVHPRFGTRNYVLPLVDQRYIEVVDVLASAGESLTEGSLTGASFTGVWGDTAGPFCRRGENRRRQGSGKCHAGSGRGGRQ